MPTKDLPAILGGTPIRPAPYPGPNHIGDAERALVKEVLDSGVLSAYVAHEGPWFGGGKMVKALETEFCTRFGAAHAVSMNSATSGIHAAVVASLAGVGDEVIIPPYTMSATATAVVMACATPVFADIDERTFCIDIEDVRRKITPRTRAIIAVNLFGGPANLVALRALADERKLVLIEDNAQGPGARQGKRFTGTIGHMGVFSLNCHKTVQCGEGGVVLTDDPVLADRLRLVRNHGEVVQDQRSSVPDEQAGLIGYNYRLSELHSAVALAQIRRLDELTEPRIAMAARLTAGLSKIPGIVTPHVEAGDRHVYYTYPFKVREAELGLSRAQLQAALEAERLPVGSGYVRPIYLYPMYGARVAAQQRGTGAGFWHRPDVPYGRGTCPVTERMHFTELMITTICRADLTEEDAAQFVHAIERIVEHRDAIRDRALRAAS